MLLLISLWVRSSIDSGGYGKKKTGADDSTGSSSTASIERPAGTSQECKSVPDLHAPQKTQLFKSQKSTPTLVSTGSGGPPAISSEKGPKASDKKVQLS